VKEGRNMKNTEKEIQKGYRHWVKDED